jgi:hypothetical protein
MLLMMAGAQADPVGGLVAAVGQSSLLEAA